MKFDVRIEKKNYVRFMDKETLLKYTELRQSVVVSHQDVECMTLVIS